MTTAEKRLQVGDDWPDCACHGMPMLWQKNLTLVEGGRFYCRDRSRANRNQLRREVVDSGRCVACRAPLDTSIRCRSCADANADNMARPLSLIRARAANARKRARDRAAEGFRPTGAGRTSFEVYLSNK